MTAPALALDEPTSVPASDTAAMTSAIAAGDREAFTRFYRRWFDTMYADARRLTGRDEAFCLDVVQDAMVRLIRRIRPLERESDLRRWLGAVVRSCAYDRLRAESRRRRHERASAQERAGTAGDDEAETRERARRLRELADEIRRLDGGAARLLEMRHRLGWTLGRIGGVVGMTPGAVDGRIRRAIARLKDRMDREDRRP